MFEALQEAVAGLDVPAHADAIVLMRRLRDQLDARLAEAESTYAREHAYEADGFGSMAAFLRQRSGMACGDGRRAARRANRLGRLDDVLSSWQGGALSGAQVDVVVSEIPDGHVARFAVTATETSAILAPLNLTDTRRALQHWVAFADSCAEREAAEAGIDAPPEPPESAVHLSRTSGGVGVLKGELDPDSTAITEHALRLATRPDVEGERRSPARRRADALVAIAQFYADRHTDGTSNRRQERVMLDCPILTLYGCALRGAGVRTAVQLQQFLDERPNLGALERGLFLEAFDGHGDVARTLDGNPISDGLLSCISEDGFLERLLTVESRVIDHGRSLRAHSASQWRALAARDGGCRYGECDDPVDGLHAHHVERWEAGGPTDIEHAVLLSGHCHTIVHQPGWSERLEPDGTYVVTNPRGEEIRSRPPGSTIDRPLPVHTTAAGAPPLPFDPIPSRDDPAEPSVEEEDREFRRRWRRLVDQDREWRKARPVPPFRWERQPPPEPVDFAAILDGLPPPGR